MAKVLNLTGKKFEYLNSGDVVSYDGATCLVVVNPDTFKSYLVSLETGYIAKEYEQTYEIKLDKKVAFVCDRNKVVIRLED